MWMCCKFYEQNVHVKPLHSPLAFLAGTPPISTGVTPCSPLTTSNCSESARTLCVVAGRHLSLLESTHARLGFIITRYCY